MTKEITTNVCKKLNVFLKQVITLLLIFTFAIPQNLFANPAGGDGDQPPQSNQPKLIDALPADKLQSIGIGPGEIQTLNTTGTFEGMKVDIDLIRGEMEESKASNLIEILRLLQPQLKKAYELDPNTKFKFAYISVEGKKNVGVEVQEILNFIHDLDTNATASKTEIKRTQSEKIKSFFHKVFGKTTKSDLYWGIARLVFNGGSSGYGFYVADIPLPTAIFAGIAMGAGSAGIGIFIEHFTAWLDKNHALERRGLRNTLTSPETFMFLAPLLIGFQQTGLTNPIGLAYLGGVVSAHVFVQNVYVSIRNRSPHAAMWYKWYATEAIFLTIPNWIFRIAEAPVRATPMEAVQSIFQYALYSTASQGIWDIFLTNRRRPYLEAAIQKDLLELAERFADKDISKMTAREVNALARQEEFKVREKYKPYYFAASFVSVTFAMIGTTGKNVQSPMLQTTALAGLFILGASGAATWAVVKVKNEGFKSLFPNFKQWMANREAARARVAELDPEMRKRAERFADTEYEMTAKDVLRLNERTAVNACANLFGM